MQHEEIEIKFVINDLEAMRHQLLALGATLKTPRTYEKNICLDTPENRLAQQGRLLRLRHDRRQVITYKEPLPQQDPHFKVRQEHEVDVSDLAQAQAILERLGFVPASRYEKYRETFTYQDAEIVLDEVPVGLFMEIEGPRPTIRAIVTRLGMDFSARLLSSYHEIFEAVCTIYQLDARDITFAAFQSVTIDLRRCNLR